MRGFRFLENVFHQKRNRMWRASYHHSVCSHVSRISINYYFSSFIESNTQTRFMIFLARWLRSIVLVTVEFRSVQTISTWHSERFRCCCTLNIPRTIDQQHLGTLLYILFVILRSEEFTWMNLLLHLLYHTNHYCVSWFIVSANYLSHDRHGQLSHDHHIFLFISAIILTRCNLYLHSVYTCYLIIHNRHQQCVRFQSENINNFTGSYW
jgi:hypothetical protein